VFDHVILLLFQLLQSLGAPHVESFNYVLREGLFKAVKDILVVEFSLPNDDRICMKFEVR
jgi:DNA-directed RNA polymerase I subunit RPA2